MGTSGWVKYVWFTSKLISLFCVLMQRVGRIRAYFLFLQISGVGNPWINRPCISENKLLWAAFTKLCGKGEAFCSPSCSRPVIAVKVCLWIMRAEKVNVFLCVRQWELCSSNQGTDRISRNSCVWYKVTRPSEIPILDLLFVLKDYSIIPGVPAEIIQ